MTSELTERLTCDYCGGPNPTDGPYCTNACRIAGERPLPRSKADSDE